MTALLDPARHAKHRIHKWWWWKRLSLMSTALEHQHARRPYVFDPARYAHTFLAFESSGGAVDPQPVPRKVWCAWTGDNEMSPNRAAGLESIRAANPKAEVILVTEENLGSFVLPEHPLHPIYPHLSYVHRSDYLRCYLMHHYGGAYTDIKRQRGSLTDAIDILNDRADLWIVGASQDGLPARIDGESRLDRDCRRNYDILPSGGAFAIRPQTALTTAWWAEVNRRADYYYDLTKTNPGGIWGRDDPGIDNVGAGDAKRFNPNYPIHWNVLQANVFEPLCLKHQDRIFLDERFHPSRLDYR